MFFSPLAFLVQFWHSCSAVFAKKRALFAACSSSHAIYFSHASHVMQARAFSPAVLSPFSKLTCHRPGLTHPNFLRLLAPSCLWCKCQECQVSLGLQRNKQNIIQLKKVLKVFRLKTKKNRKPNYPNPRSSNPKLWSWTSNPAHYHLQQHQ